MFTKFLSSFVLVAIPCTSFAATIEITFDQGSQQYQSEFGIRDDTATRGWDLNGMGVTASYLDGTSESLVWSGSRAELGGGVSGSGLNLFYGFNTFELSVQKSITSLSMNARSGNAIFDASMSLADGEDTFGTKIGFPFRIEGDDTLDGTITAHYSDPFSVEGYTLAPDAYTNLTIDFTGLTDGGLGSDINFRTDVDSLEVAGDISPVPVPASLFLFASAFGVAGLGLSRKKAKSA